MPQADHQTFRGSLWSEVRLAYGLLPTLTVLERQAIDPGPLLDRAGIARFGLMDPAYTIAIRQELGFMHAAIQALNGPEHSLTLAREYRLRGFSVLGLAMQACQTPAQMLSLILTYPRLAWGISDCRVDIDTQRLQAEMRPPTPLGAIEGFLVERDMACALVLLDQVLEAPFAFQRVQFRHACDGNPAEYAAFFRCPVEFGQPRHAITADAEMARQPLPNANATMCSFYAAQCERMSRAMDQPFRYAEAVRTRLQRRDPIPDLPGLAASLLMTPRTLQRRLRAEGASFSQLLREVRQQRADQLLMQGSDDMESIAASLGFGDAVAFSHAYKSWTGQAPRHRRDASTALPESPASR